MILAALYGLLTAVLWGTADFISRKPAKEIGYYLVSGYTQLFSFCGLAIYLLVSQQMDLTTLISNKELTIVNLLIGFSSFVALTFLFRGFTVGIMSVVSPIVSASPLVAIVLGIVAFGQVPTTVRIYGISMVMVGVILVGIRLSEFRNFLAIGRTPHSVPDSQNRRPATKPLVVNGESAIVRLDKRLYKGMSSALVSCFAFGSIYFGLGIVTPVFGFAIPITIMRGGGALFSFLLLTPLKQKLTWPHGETLVWLLLMALMDSGAYLSLDLGLLSAKGSLPIVVTMSGLLSVVVIILARIFYEDKLDKIQVVGIPILLIGVATILYFQ